MSVAPLPTDIDTLRGFNSYTTFDNSRTIIQIRWELPAECVSRLYRIMNSRHTFSVFLAVVFVPVALAFAAASLKAAALSIVVFWACLGIFFYPSINDYLKDRNRRGRD